MTTRDNICDLLLKHADQDDFIHILKENREMIILSSHSIIDKKAVLYQCKNIECFNYLIDMWNIDPIFINVGYAKSLEVIKKYIYYFYLFPKHDNVAWQDPEIMHWYIKNQKINGKVQKRRTLLQIINTNSIDVFNLFLQKFDYDDLIKRNYDNLLLDCLLRAIKHDSKEIYFYLVKNYKLILTKKDWKHVIYRRLSDSACSIDFIERYGFDKEIFSYLTKFINLYEYVDNNNILEKCFNIDPFIMTTYYIFTSRNHCFDELIKKQIDNFDFYLFIKIISKFSKKYQADYENILIMQDLWSYTRIIIVYDSICLVNHEETKNFKKISGDVQVLNLSKIHHNILEKCEKIYRNRYPTQKSAKKLIF